MSRRTLTRAVAAMAVAVTLTAPAARGQTLADALVQAYQTSPALDVARAELRRQDELVAQARAGRRPQVGATASGQATQRTEGPGRSSEQLSAGLRASLLLYDHGQSRAAIESARHQIGAGRANLRNTEQAVLFGAVEAFMDVRRDQQSVAIAANDVRVLEEQLRAARDRFEVGEITRTDVSLTEARLAASRAALVAAQGQLEISRAAYRAAVGGQPTNLQPPPPLPQLPGSLQAASAIGLQNAPEIVAARLLERAAAFDVERSRAAGGPRVEATGTANYVDQPAQGLGATGRQRDVVGTAGVNLNLPLYEGGGRSSLIRQAQAALEERQWRLQDAGRVVTQRVASAWTSYGVAGAQITARRQQVEAARVAAAGIAEEARLGARSQLDVLDAEQERLVAEFDLVRAIRDEYVAGYDLLRAMGLLTVEHLGLGIETYDPEVNFLRVQGAPTGTDRGSALERIRGRWE
jgi:outer membrane protein